MSQQSPLNLLSHLWRHPVAERVPELADRLEHWMQERWGADPDPVLMRQALSPQWVVLAAGSGSRIDPTGRLNKLLDIWIGGRNVLQWSVAHLPTDRPPILVVSPAIVRRVLRTEQFERSDSPRGEVPVDCLDSDAVAHWLVPGARLVVQPTPDGTGGALRAAAPLLDGSDAELLGVAFGDEPFLGPQIYLETLIVHLLGEADATLCGKRPESVAGKGGVFFDSAGRLIGTKEWYDMSPEEQRWMEDRLTRGEAVTNTGISIFKRELVLPRLGRLWLHKDGTEYHHVDLFRIFYEDGLHTQAHVYERPVPSGVNRWENVGEGEAHLAAESRQALVRRGVWVHPHAEVFAEPDAEIGRCVRLRGRVLIGEDVRVQPYSLIEESQLFQDVRVGTRCRVVRSRLEHVQIEDADGTTPIGAPGEEFQTLTSVEGAELSHVWIGAGAVLRGVRGRWAVVPPGVLAAERSLGIRRDPSLGWSLDPPPLWELVPEGYVPGVFRFGEKRSSEEWDRLREHIRRVAVEELAARASLTPTLASRWERTVEVLLGEEAFPLDPWTPEEIWGLLLEAFSLLTRAADPYQPEKRLARRWAFQVLEQWAPDPTDWRGWLRLSLLGNLIDFTSRRMGPLLERLNSWDAATAAQWMQAEPLAIDSSELLIQRIEGPPQTFVWLADNDGEAVFDLAWTEQLIRRGHWVVWGTRSTPAFNDATQDDVLQALQHPRLRGLREAIATGQFQLLPTGSTMVGTNLYQLTPTFFRALRKADVVVAKGQGNWYTTQRLRKDVFYLFVSKGMTAERSAGVVAHRSPPLDGMICAFVPAGTSWEGPLTRFAKTT